MKKSSSKSALSMFENLKNLLDEMREKQETEKKKKNFSFQLKMDMKKFSKDEIHIGI
jgi:hypothetical protein